MAADDKRFTALGQEWIARFDFNSVCELEERYDQPFLAIVAPMLGGLDESDRNNPEKQAEAASRIRMSDIRTILHQTLAANHEGVTLERAGEIIADMGIESAMEVIAWAVMKALPQNKGGEGKADGNPPRKRAKRTS